jgi:orotidine-5'-phosphate decarboxylase
VKLCISLDNDNIYDNISLVKKIKSHDMWLKVGLRSFIRDGIGFIEELKSINSNFKIFLDLKLYDIPNTMLDSVIEICKLDIDMFNIHASSGESAMSLISEYLSTKEKRPIVLAVTALTSFDNETFSKIYSDSIENRVEAFGKMAYQNNLDGVVCSVYESLMIKKSTNKDFLTLSPGIRLKNSSNDDQKRVADIKTAINNCVDFAVIGRPIYQAKDPYGVVCEVLQEINREL